jgi:hypothetical protein
MRSVVHNGEEHVMADHRHSLSWFWFLPTLVLLLAGLGLGVSSYVTQHVPTLPSAPSLLFQMSQQGVTYHIAMGKATGNVYINADGSSDYFVAFSGDFQPPITQSDIDNSATLDFIARMDTSSLNPALNANGTTIHAAHKIEKLVFYDTNGNTQTTFITAEYTASLANQNRAASTTSSSPNEWPPGLAFILAGLLWGAGTTIVLLQRQAHRRTMLAQEASAPFFPMYPYQQPSYPPSPPDYLNNSAVTPPPTSYPPSGPISEQFYAPSPQAEPPSPPPPYSYP